MKKMSMTFVCALAAAAGVSLAQSGGQPTTGTTQGKPQNDQTIRIAPKNTTNTTNVQRNPNGKRVSIAKRNLNAGGTTSPLAISADNPHAPWLKAHQPRIEQVELSKLFVGEWNATATTWTTPGATPVSTNGLATFYPTMNGRFVASDFEGTLRQRPFRSTGFFGFNNAENRYESVWVDSDNTGVQFFTGTRTSTNTFTWNTSTTDPVTGQPKTIRAVTTLNGRDRITHTVFETLSGGKEFKALEIAYSRTGPGGPGGFPADNRAAQTKTTGTTTKTTGVNTNNTGVETTGNK
jgi:hypothetical protein